MPIYLYRMFVWHIAMHILYMCVFCSSTAYLIIYWKRNHLSLSLYIHIYTHTYVHTYKCNSSENVLLHLFLYLSFHFRSPNKRMCSFSMMMRSMYRLYIISYMCIVFAWPLHITLCDIFPFEFCCYCFCCCIRYEASLHRVVGLIRRCIYTS